MLRALLDGQGKCEAAFRCRRTTSAVPECVWAPQRQVWLSLSIVATSAAAAVAGVSC